MYAPRDPIREYWRGDITLRALRVLVMHMPAGNAFEQAMGDGWNETQWLIHDIGDQLRDMQLTQVATNPWVKASYGEKDIRPRTKPPRQRRMNHATRLDAQTMQQRQELMAALSGKH